MGWIGGGVGSLTGEVGTAWGDLGLNVGLKFDASSVGQQSGNSCAIRSGTDLSSSVGE